VDADWPAARGQGDRPSSSGPGRGRTGKHAHPGQLLSHGRETDMLDAVTAAFSPVVVLLNVGSVMEWLDGSYGRAISPFCACGRAHGERQRPRRTCST
jgi:hypothetical protein